MPEVGEFEGLFDEILVHVGTLSRLVEEGDEVFELTDEEAARMCEPDEVLEAQAELSEAWESADDLLGRVSALLDELAHEAEWAWFDDRYHLDLESGSRSEEEEERAAVADRVEVHFEEVEAGIDEEAEFADRLEGYLEELELGDLLDDLEDDAFLGRFDGEDGEMVAFLDGTEEADDWYFTEVDLYDLEVDEYDADDLDVEDRERNRRNPQYEDDEWDSDNEEG